MSKTPLVSIQGYAYRARSSKGIEFLHIKTFGKTKTKARTNFKIFNFKLCEQHKPCLEPLELCDVTITITKRPAVGDDDA